MFAVSPRIAARARERYRVAAVKDDRLDALVLADTLRYEHPQWRALTPPSPLLAEIRALTRDRDRLQQTQQAVESQLRAILEAYHPAPTRLFSSVDRQITLHFVPGKSYSAQSFTRLLQLLNTQLAEYDDAIAAAAAEHPDTPIFASFPGVGDVLTGVLLAEIGEDRTRFPAANVLLAEAGLAPVTRSSGRSRKVRFRYAANTILREATTWWAYNSMKEAPWAKAAFRDARDRRGQHYHRALRGLAARWRGCRRSNRCKCHAG